MEHNVFVAVSVSYLPMYLSQDSQFAVDHLTTTTWSFNGQGFVSC